MEVSVHQWSLGYVLIASDSESGKLYALELGNDVNECYKNFYNRWSKLTNNWKHEIESRKNFQIVEKIIQFIDFGIVDPSLQLEIQWHPFATTLRRKVWEVIMNTKPGEILSYKEVAEKINNPNAMRVIGNACGANPFAIIIPCHRIIKSNGEYGEYRWGSDLKRKLLEREKFLFTNKEK